ncbi:MAG: hypothetical protein WBN39_15240 [Flavobacteriaceae bacterium]
MKKVSILTGIGLLSLVLFSFNGKDKCEKEVAIAYEALQQPFLSGLPTETNPTTLNINEIDYVELEGEFDLGFEPADYLPLGFNAYQGMDLDLDDIVYVEEEEDIDLGFDTADYLPKGFNAYEGMDLDLQVALEELDLNSIIYIEEEEEIQLDFPSRKYLPRGFNPYAK